MKSSIALLLLLLLPVLFPLARGEYRVYQYLVRQKMVGPWDKKQNLISSTLDPVSFHAYHGGASLIQADLLRTWLCPGDTSGLANLCPSPYEVLQTNDLLERPEP